MSIAPRSSLATAVRFRVLESGAGQFRLQCTSRYDRERQPDLVRSQERWALNLEQSLE